ncbi:MAG: metal ABC transporter substrate-binding protein [Acidobacteriota bacterium]
MKKIWTVLLAALSLQVLAGAPLKVVAVYPDYGWLAQQVGGGYVKVSVLAKGTQDPHFVDPKPSFLVDLHRADLLLVNGLQLEVGFLPPLLTQCGNAKIQPGASGYVDLSTFIQPIEVPSGGVDRSMGDIHPYGNPHYHLDPRNMAAIATGLGGVFAGADPAHGADYRKNAAAVAQELNALDGEMAKTLAPLRGEPVAAYHQTLDYFFLHYGFHVVGFVEPKPGIKPSPSSLMELEKTLREKQVKLLIVENYEDIKIASKVAADTGARLAVIPSYTGGAPEAQTYPALLRTIAKDLLGEGRG